MRQQANAATILLQQALALHQKGQMAPAEELYKKALAKAPDHFETNYLYGMLKLHQEDWETAAQQLGKAITLKPAHIDTYLDHATALQHLDRHEEAIASLDRAVALKPDFADALLQRGNSQRQIGRTQAALASYKSALAIDGNIAEAWFQSGNVQHRLKQYSQALENYRKAVELRPDFAEAWFNLGNTLKDLERLEEALEAYDRALAMEPDFAQALTNRGYVLFLLKRATDALESYDRAAGLDDASAELWFNRGSTLEDLQRFDEAIASYQRAQQLDPDGASPHWNESLTRLLLGDFQAGWEKYEWRWLTEQMRDFQRRRLPQPLWLGEESLQGKTILLHAEQGYGDTLQFSRFAPQLAAQGARVILEVQPPLKNLMANLPGVSQVITRDEFPLPRFDFHCPLMSLPLACGMISDDDIPRAPYLVAEPKKWAAWNQRLPQNRALRVGLVWSGNPRVNNAAANRIDSLRSTAFDTLAPIVELARDQGGVEFYSLQVGDNAAAQLRRHPLAGYVTDFSAELRDFSETAGLIANLDLVISVDTSVCHLAGALGKPVWLLNRFNTCWRWQLDRSDTPWYQNFTIFRQSTLGEWSDVIEQMREALSAHLAGE
ncbi:MAG: TPR repeat-containing protein YrrB [Herbaspirillum frisingense]|uniref:TPR repeat-containing protein YrrB n=1 Tax=Herbaspirillum frisingense TaxID=92645 RepID=A0A7V8FUD6_9BURK|nr:MAG: TPR repeat-containing protein YrrB [Herbaspirillum frisingense]